MSAYLALLRGRPHYRTIWAAELVSITGDWFSLVAVSILAASASPDKGGLALATVLAAHLLPQALLAPVAGWLADRFDRRALLVGGNFVEGLLTLGMLAEAVGVLPQAGVAFVAQRHGLGRVTFLSWDGLTTRTITGYELGAQIVD